MAGTKRVSQVIAEYLSNLARRRLAKDTQQGYKYLLDRFQEAMRHDVYITTVTAVTMQRFFYGGEINGGFYPGLIQYKGTRGRRKGRTEIEGSTWNAYRRQMIKFLKDLQMAGEIKESWFSLMQFVPEVKEADPDPIILSPEQIVVLLAEAPNAYEAALLTLCVDYAKRAAEIGRLKVSDWKRNRRVIRWTITKSRKRETRIVERDITPDAWERVEAWLREYAAYFGMTFEEFLDKARDWYLFPSRWSVTTKYTPYVVDKKTGKRTRTALASRIMIRPHLAYSEPWKVIQAGLARLGYTEDEISGNGIHCTRRSAACAEIDDSGDIRAAQHLLDHENQLTTERYVRRSRESERLNDKLRKGGWRQKYIDGGTVTAITRKDATSASA